MNLQLRKYQQEAVDAVYRHLREKDTNPCVVLPVGTGKSVVLAKIAADAVNQWNGRVLVLAHVKELLEQNAEKIRFLAPELKVGIYSAGLNSRDTKENVIVAGIQSVYNKADRLGAFDLVITDECFIEGTLIDTPRGKVPIEDLYVGQPVYHALGVGNITALSSRPSTELIQMELNDGTTIKCTPNHRFFTDDGWKEARTMEVGAHLYRNEDMSNLRKRFSSKSKDGCKRENIDERRRIEMGTKKILLNGMPKDWSIDGAQKDAGIQGVLAVQGENSGEVLPMLREGDKAEILSRCSMRRECMEQDEILFNILLEESGESDVQTGCCTESVKHFERDWAQAEYTRRQRNAVDSSSRGNSENTWRLRGDGVPCINDEGTKKTGCCELLQDRCCDSVSADRNSIGWREPSIENSENERQENKEMSCGIRVVNIAYIKLERPCAVYNIQVEGHPSYYANGVLVHNCHLIPPDGEGMYRTFFSDMKIINPNVRIIGFTATPYRLKGGLICKPENILNEVCYEAGLKEMIVQGYLSPLVSKSGSTMTDFESLHIRGGEFISDEMEVLMNNDKLVRNACQEIVELTKDRNAVLIFGVSIDHCKNIKKRIEEYSGEECAMVTGDTPAGERARILERIRGKEETDLFGNKLPRLRYLVNCAVLTTGFDAPNIDCIAILRPTASPGLLIQMVGRGIRLSPATGKRDCLVLDYGENILRHGPLDAIRVEDRKPGKRDGEKPAKKCPKCNALIETARTVCPQCGYEFPPRELKHDGFASTDGLLSGQVTDMEYDVTSVSYNRWQKKKAENAPPTVMVEYCIGFGKYQREWLCPEHTGYARQKFEKWWEEHNCAEFSEPPNSVDEFIELANSGQVKCPSRITVRHITGEPFDRVVKYVYGEQHVNAVVPIEQDDEYTTPTELEYSGLDYDDVPF